MIASPTPLPLPGPPPGQPGPVRRLLPHLVWEAVLLVTLLLVWIALGAAYPAAFSRGAFWGQAAYAAMYAGALALSLRTATPNLAVTTIGAACGWWYVSLIADGMSPVLAWLVVLAAALGIGLVLGALVGVTPLPAWAVSLVATGILAGSLLLGDDSGAVPLQQAGTGTGVYVTWTVLFLIGSVAVGALFAVPSIRTLLSQNRLVPGAPAARVPGRLLGALVGLGGSSLLAGIGGVLFVMRMRAAQPFDGVGMAFALAAVLLAGVSMLGGRGGVAGVAIAVLLLVLVQLWMNLEGVTTGGYRLVFGLLATLGLGVNVLMEWLGGRMERGQAGLATQQPWPQAAGWTPPGTPPQPAGWTPPGTPPQPAGWPQPTTPPQAGEQSPPPPQAPAT